MSLDPKSSDDSISISVNQTIKLSGLKHHSTRKREIEEFSYQPNFVLVDANGQNSRAVFGDIVPLYSSYDEVVSLIVTSWDSLYDFILHSSSFMICLLSIANQLINNAAYYSYTVVLAGYQEVVALPDRFNRLKQQYTELLEIVTTAETRSLLWLEVKLDVQTALDKLLKLYEQVWFITQKFYLSFIVVSCLGILSFSSVLNSSSSSFLTNFLSNNTVINSQALITNVDTGTTQVASASAIKSIPVKKILEHTIQEGEDLSFVSSMYSINVETIKFNNQLTEEPAVGTSLFIPWSEGYIYNTPKEYSVEQLAQIFEVDAEVLKSQNEAVVNPENGSIAENTLVLVPTNDFAAIQINLDQEAEREASAKRAQEAEAYQQRLANLRASAVSANTYAGAFSDAPESTNFIWPTEGNISRCVQPGHIACDIANFTAPPIWAMQGGTVISSGWDTTGYGYMILIDHGTIDGRNYKTLYAHMSELYVTAGQEVKQGAAIGRMGNTGYSTGTHLHFEVIVDGAKINPLNFLS